jgi:5-methylcytosine-specific restriction endonuclease McrA
MKSPANNNDTELHIDHIIPLSRGGENCEENLQTLCKKCNLTKKNNMQLICIK